MSVIDYYIELFREPATSRTCCLMDSKPALDSNGSHYFICVHIWSTALVCACMELLWSRYLFFFLNDNNTTELWEEQMRQHLRLLIILAKLNLLRGSVGVLSVFT